ERGPDPLGRLLQAGPPEDVPGPTRPGVEVFEGRLQGPPGNQPPGRRGPAEVDERNCDDFLEDERPRDDDGKSAVSDGTPDRLSENEVRRNVARRCSRFAASGSRTPACGPRSNRGTMSSSTAGRTASDRRPAAIWSSWKTRRCRLDSS